MGKHRILVVEDEQIVAAGLCKRLASLGYEVPGTAAAGEEAVRLAEELRPNLVLMDIRLEGAMDGVEAAALIRSRFRIPVIYLTAYSNAEVLDRAKLTEPHGYVLKPFDERELHVVVEMALYKHRAEEALHQRERWLSAVLTSIGDAVVTTDDAGRVTWMSPRAEGLTGWATAEAKGKDVEQVFQIVHEGTRQAVEAPLYKAMREGVIAPLANDTVLVARDKTERPIDDCAAPITDAGGATLGGVMVFRDVTARKLAEEALRLRDRAIQAVSQGIVITGPHPPECPIIYVSPGFVRLTGYEAHEVVGRNCRFLQGPDTDRETVAQVRAALQAEQAIAVGLLNYRKDGRPFWNALSIAPIHDDSGKVTHFVGVLTDVTERRKLEAQFRQAQKLEAIGRLAGGVAHDFNNMLTVINGYSQIVTGMLPKHDKARELVEEIFKAGERAAGLTRQLLAYGRKQFLQPQVFSLNDLLARVDKLLRRMIGEDIELVTVAAPDLLPVKADPGQLEQVVMNLAVNARDAMPTGGKLTIETQNIQIDEGPSPARFEAPPGPYVLLAVTDTGSGMDEATKANIFEPFFTTKGEGLGTGLGLATVYGIVKQSDGQIQVYSEPGHGTTFIIYLPSATGAALARGPGQAPQALGGTETVLLVEDEAAVRSLTHYVLKQYGYKVLVASSGAEALEIAARHEGPLDLLITDVVMPRMSGRQLAEALLRTRPGLGAMYLSGYTDDAVFRHGIQGPETSVLQKPFTLSALAQKVRERLDRKAQPPKDEPAAGP
jgi:PAS domain S-box-containing protein